MTAQDTAPVPPAPAPTPKWQRWVYGIVGVVLALSAFGKIASFFDTSLPACDSKRAKDTLSNVFQEKGLKPTSYSEVKTLSSTKDLVECQATLPVNDKEMLTVKYKFISVDSKSQIQYSITSGPR